MVATNPTTNGAITRHRSAAACNPSCDAAMAEGATPTMTIPAAPGDRTSFCRGSPASAMTTADRRSNGVDVDGAKRSG